jgi:hypothetical protein
MAALVRNLEVYAGVDFSRAEGFFNPDPSGFGNPLNLVPYNFTNFNARMNIRLGPSTTDALVAALTNPTNLAFVVVSVNPGPATPTNPNGIQITIPKALSLSWQTTYPQGFTGVYNLYADNLGSGTTQLLMSGPFILVPGT